MTEKKDPLLELLDDPIDFGYDTHSENFEEGLSEAIAEEGQSSGEYAVVWIALIAIALGVFILLLIGEI